MINIGKRTLCSTVGSVIIQLLVQRNWTNAILFISLACMISVWIRLHSVLLPLLITDLLNYLLCTFFHILLFLLMHSLNIVYFLYASSDCTMKTRTSKLITYFWFVSVVYFLYLLLVVLRKMNINTDHISCAYFLCIHQVYIRYNGGDLCTLFVYKLGTNHLHTFVRDSFIKIRVINKLTDCLTPLGDKDIV